MAFSSTVSHMPLLKSLVLNGTRTCLRPTSLSSASLSYKTPTGVQPLNVAKPTLGASPLMMNRMAVQPLHTTMVKREINSDAKFMNNSPNIADVLEKEIQDESAELNRHLSSDQFPGFSIETDNSDVKLSKKIGNATVNVRFTVSSSLNEWAVNDTNEQQDDPMASKLLSLPEFQVQISKGGSTLEISCFFEEDMGQNVEEGEVMCEEPYFCIDELVLYEGEPKQTEFAVSAEFFEEDLQSALLQYLADHGIDDTFTKNLVAFSTSYEKKQYIGLMKRLKNFVSK